MAKEKRFIKVHSEGLGANEIWVDSETGVNYFYHNGGYGGGLTPLLDAFGKPIITPITKE
ncbi:MAG: xylan 1,4-beta-xylosidase [Clostridia bacterium]|nr:xylan 1,4-beta-xylosidase [Clostridia bacterium]